MNEPVIIKKIGLIYGRDAIHLDKITFDKNFNNVKLIGVLSGKLCKNIQSKEWIKYEIVFKNIVDFRIVKEGLFDDSKYTSSFEKVINTDNNKNHYIFHTYDDVLELFASDFEIRI